MIKNVPDRAVIYARVSSIKQVKEGSGVSSQASRCEMYAKLKHSPTMVFLVHSLNAPE